MLLSAAAKASEPVIAHARDFSQEKPVSDQVFKAFKSLYSYDKTPLHAVIESTEQTDDWTQQKITFDAAYGKERMIAYLFLPKKGQPPFQTVLYFPGGDAIETRSLQRGRTATGSIRFYYQERTGGYGSPVQRIL